MSHSPSVTHSGGGVSPGPSAEDLLSNKPQLSLSLSLGLFFDLEAGHLQGLQIHRYSPTIFIEHSPHLQIGDRYGEVTSPITLYY